MKRIESKIIVNSQHGMSIIEILIALTLLAIGGAFMGTKIFERFHEGKVSAARIQMRNLANSLKDYKRHCSTYPTTEQGLEALVSKPSAGKECKRYAPGGYIEGDEVPMDPWDFPYVYSSDGKKFNIISYGQDNEEGGEGQDADIPLNE
jgi:general secretion pathway protein G